MSSIPIANLMLLMVDDSSWTQRSASTGNHGPTFDETGRVEAIAPLASS
ncbi:MAG: hypothetical protein F6K09_24190 [Merismopedia sp. SIO2A8]|nr:hypothetical protein [Merismopedia sp. SIO2A8]